MIKVFVLDKNLKPQNPVHPAVAWILLSRRKACVHRAQPFCIRLSVASFQAMHGLQLKIDPRSVTTGVALVNHASGLVLLWDRWMPSTPNTSHCGSATTATNIRMSNHRRAAIKAEPHVIEELLDCNGKNDKSYTVNGI